jgi:hypothetical protein
VKVGPGSPTTATGFAFETLQTPIEVVKGRCYSITQCVQRGRSE